MIRRLAAAIVLVLTPRCPGFAAGETFTIPVIVPLTGAGAEYGAGDKTAIQLAIYEINAQRRRRRPPPGRQPARRRQPADSGGDDHAGLVGDSLVVLGPI